MATEDNMEYYDADEADTIIISKDEYVKLIEYANTLEALYAAGVDNWDGYLDAMEAMLE